MVQNYVMINFIIYLYRGLSSVSLDSPQLPFTQPLKFGFPAARTRGRTRFSNYRVLNLKTKLCYLIFYLIVV